MAGRANTVRAWRYKRFRFVCLSRNRMGFLDGMAQRSIATLWGHAIDTGCCGVVRGAMAGRPSTVRLISTATHGRVSVVARSEVVEQWFGRGECRA
jgi:hypothetical protein